MTDPASSAPRPPPRIKPPLVALGFVLFAWGLNRLIRPAWIVPWPWNLLGILVIAAGVTLVAAVMRLFLRVGTTFQVDERPTRLVRVGPYRFTRNPMYVGVTTILLGIGVLVSTWPFLVIPPVGFVLIITLFYIRREERVMEHLFGAEYDDFRRRVRRWL